LPQPIAHATILKITNKLYDSILSKISCMIFNRIQINVILFLSASYMSDITWCNEVVTNLEEIVVVGYKESNVINRSDIERSGAHNLSQLLQGRAGINVYPANGNAAKSIIDMRGFGITAGANTLILLDGVRLNNSSDLAPPDLSVIDLDMVERVEINHGNNGVLFGNQAVGGVINIITRVPQRATQQIQAGIGSFEAYSLRASTSGNIGANTGYRIHARTSENTLDRDQSRTQRHQGAARFDHIYDSGNISLEQRVQREYMQLPGSLFAEELAIDRHQSVSAYRGDFSTIETMLTNIRFSQNLSDNWDLTTVLSFRDNDGKFKLSGRAWAGTPSTQTRQSIQFNPYISGNLPVAWAKFNLTIGSELETVDYRLKTGYGTQAEIQDSYSIYTQLSTQYDEMWNATFGLRYAQVQNHIENSTLNNLNDSVAVGSISLAYEPTNNWRLFSTWEQNYRFATVDEHTNVITGQSAGLNNQTGDSYTVGAAYQNSDFKLQLQHYWLKLHNEIGFDTSTYFNINLPNTRRRGGLLEFIWTPNKVWRVGGDYTFTNSRITSGAFAGNTMPLVPRHSGRMFLDYQVMQDADLQISSRWVGKRTLGGDFNNDFKPMPGYGLVDLAANYHIGTWMLSARVDNIFNHKYNADGAVGYDSSFNMRGAFFPATGRSIWLTVNYEP
jgi:iron complex outermembrane receptor protein